MSAIALEAERIVKAAAAPVSAGETVKAQMNRAGLPPKGRRKKPTMIARPPETKPAVKLPPAIVPQPGSGTILFLDRGRNQCAWPDWEDYGPLPPIASRKVCGLPIARKGVPYCVGHCAVAYVPRQSPKMAVSP